jgi:hypothetical protein
LALHVRVFNVSRQYSMKQRQALRAVEQCAAIWVEFGVSIRDCTLAESIARRNQQAQIREPLAFAELPGCVYRPTERNQAQTRQGYELTRAANQFAEMPA